MIEINKVWTGEYIVSKDGVDVIVLKNENELLELQDRATHELLTIAYERGDFVEEYICKDCNKAIISDGMRHYWRAGNIYPLCEKCADKRLNDFIGIVRKGK